jgi:alpha-glucoside transport system permease protein
MHNIAGTKSPLLGRSHLRRGLVLLWLFPTVGLFVSSFRTADQIAVGLVGVAVHRRSRIQVLPHRGPDEQVQMATRHHRQPVRGPAMSPSSAGAFLARSTPTSPAITADLGDGERLTCRRTATIRLATMTRNSGGAASASSSPPRRRPNSRSTTTAGPVLGRHTDSMAKAFFNTLTVTIPATVIPIVVAAFAAYALAWMDFPAARC